MTNLPRRTIPARTPIRQSYAYIDVDIDFSQEGDVVTVGVLPDGAHVVDAFTYVSTAFDDGEESPTATIDIGTSGNPDAFNNDADLSSAGTVRDATTFNAATDLVMSDETTIVAEVNGDGENALTAGEGKVVVVFIPPR